MTSKEHLIYKALPFALAGVTASYFIIGLPREHLYFDEIFPATYSSLSAFDLLVSSLRFDAHPPLYYLQLMLWALPDPSDKWRLLNSVFWSVLAVCSVVGLRGRETSKLDGNIAGLLFALLPGTVLYANLLRMYAMETCLTIWLAIAIRRAVSNPVAGGWAITAVFLELALLYSNAGAPIIVLCAMIYGFLLLIEHGASHRGLARWLIRQIVVGILAAPVIINSLLRSAAHPKVPTLADIPGTIVYLYAGPLSSNPIAYWGTLAVFSIATIYGLGTRTYRSMTISFVVLPFILACSISHVLRPIWLERLFLFTMPFWAVILVGGVRHLARRMSALGIAWRDSVRRRHNPSQIVIVLCTMRLVRSEYYLHPARLPHCGCHHSWRTPTWRFGLCPREYLLLGHCALHERARLGLAACGPRSRGLFRSLEVRARQTRTDVASTSSPGAIWTRNYDW